MEIFSIRTVSQRIERFLTQEISHIMSIFVLMIEFEALYKGIFTALLVVNKTLCPCRLDYR
jgi:hypothetical protein